MHHNVIVRALNGFQIKGFNHLIANNIGNASRARHLLRRYVAMQERVKSGEIILGKVDDAENPSDYLTKWLKARKLLDQAAGDEDFGKKGVERVRKVGAMSVFERNTTVDNPVSKEMAAVV